MKTGVIYSDIHCYGICPLYSAETILRIIEDDAKIYKFVILNGDTVDLKNCKQKDLAKAKKLMADLELLRKKYINIIYINIGNHDDESGAGINSLTIIDNHLFVHGDVALWGLKIASEYRKKKNGCNNISRIFKKIWANYHGKISKQDGEKLAIWAKTFKCSTIHCSHVHPKNNYTGVHNGIKVNVYIRGRRVITII